MITTIGLSGLGIYVLTGIFKRLQKKYWNVMKTKAIVWILVIIAGAIYYYFTQYQPNLLEQVTKFAIGAFWVSQAIWMLIEWYLPKDPVLPPTPVV